MFYGQITGLEVSPLSVEEALTAEEYEWHKNNPVIHPHFCCEAIRLDYRVSSSLCGELGGASLAIIMGVDPNGSGRPQSLVTLGASIVGGRHSLAILEQSGVDKWKEALSRPKDFSSRSVAGSPRRPGTIRQPGYGRRA